MKKNTETVKLGSGGPLSTDGRVGAQFLFFTRFLYCLEQLSASASISRTFCYVYLQACMSAAVIVLSCSVWGSMLRRGVPWNDLAGCEDLVSLNPALHNKLKKSILRANMTLNIVIWKKILLQVGHPQCIESY